MDERAIRSHEGHEEFHVVRRMYVIRDGSVCVAPRGSTLSHIEWFEKEGWVAGSNTQEFMEGHTRGFYLPSENIFHSYRGMGFFFDDAVIEEVKLSLPQLREALGLQDDTKVIFGPRDASFRASEYEKRYLGTVGELVG
jgi:hypothetical protein